MSKCRIVNLCSHEFARGEVNLISHTRKCLIDIIIFSHEDARVASTMLGDALAAPFAPFRS